MQLWIDSTNEDSATSLMQHTGIDPMVSSCSGFENSHMTECCRHTGKISVLDICIMHVGPSRAFNTHSAVLSSQEAR